MPFFHFFPLLIFQLPLERSICLSFSKPTHKNMIYTSHVPGICSQKTCPFQILCQQNPRWESIRQEMSIVSLLSCSWNIIIDMRTQRYTLLSFWHDLDVVQALEQKNKHHKDLYSNTWRLQPFANMCFNVNMYCDHLSRVILMTRELKFVVLKPIDVPIRFYTSIQVFNRSPRY